MTLTHEQVTQLLRPINPRRVGRRDGMSHLEAYDVRAHLDRIFGFGEWSGDVLDMTLLYEAPTTLKNGKDGYSVGYRCTYRLTIHATGATYTEVAAGDAQMPSFKRADAHDFAIKTAESQALKRCAINLGDQFGLSLYNQGSLDPLVGRTLNMPTPIEKDSSKHTINDAINRTEGVDSHVTQVAPESPAPQAEPTQVPPLPGEAAPAGQDHADDATRIRDLVVNKAPEKRPGNERRNFLLKLLAEAGGKGVAGAMVVAADGHGVMLERLIQDAIKEAAA